ncbi:BnaC03g74350D [Brassica napus]|uniref:BnaC03g74350D protein n=1 Tax=Brassica napus TaxID=3708 RepID=A0A078IIP5_BRANA|nr:BnaC03g74350D [Brassica napus]
MYGIKYAKPNYTSQVVRKQINPILIRTGLEYLRKCSFSST